MKNIYIQNVSKFLAKIVFCLCLLVLFFTQKTNAQSLPNIQRFDTLTVCDNQFPILYSDSIYTEAGDFQIIYHLFVPDEEEAAEPIAVDSIIYLHISSLESYLAIDTLFVCANDFPVTAHGTTCFTAGEYIHHFYSINLCDSIIWFYIIVNPVYELFDTISVCANGSNSYPIENRGHTILSSGDYAIPFVSEYGCDSIIRLRVNDRPYYFDYDETTICSQELPFTYGDSTFYAAGTYLIYFNSTVNCDSVIEFTLNVNPDYYIYDTVSVCAENLPHLYRDVYYTTPGDYVLTHTSEFGCDSIIYFAFRINHQTTPLLTGSHDLCVTTTSTISISNNTNYVAYQWSNGLSSPSITLNTAGDFRVITTDNHGCHDTSSYFNVVNYLPVYITAEDTVICAGKTTTFTAHGGTLYHWSTGSNSANITVNEQKSYYVTISNNVNCINYDTISLRLYPLPDLTITPTQSICINANAGATLPTHTLLTVSDSSLLTSFVWSNGGNSSSIDVNPIIRTTYIVTATNQYACTATAQTMVIPLPEITLDGNLTLCKGEQTTLTATGGIQYDWTGTTDFTYNIAFYAPLNNTNCAVKVTTTEGCFNNKTFQIIVNPLPTTGILGANSFCVGDSVELTSYGGTSYLWSTGKTGNKIFVKTTNSYIVTTTNEYSCSATASFQVTSKALPTPQITGALTFCAGNNTTLTATGGGQYSWNTNAQVASITVSTGGTYTVTVTNADGCKATISATTTMNPAPTISISGNETFCYGNSTTFTVAGTNCTYSWNTGATNSSIQTYTSGLFSVTATNTQGCTATASKTATRLDLPTPVITGASSICTGESTSLIASGGISYQWSTGATTPTINVNSSGIFTVTVTGTNGCSDQISKSVTVQALPTASISSPRLTICQGESTTLTAVGGNTFNWSNGSVTQAITVNNSGIYTVTVTNSNGCSAVTSATVTVIPLPNVTISGNLSFCANQTTTLSVPTGYNTYSWTGGGSTYQKIVSQPGSYSVTVTDNAGCSNTASVSVSSLPIPVITITGNTTICQGNSTNLVANADNVDHYSWSTGATTPFISVSQTGTYTVTITNTNGCVANKSETVLVNNLPNIVITGNNTICNGGSTQLTASMGSNYSYEWTTGQTTRFITVNPITTTTYTVFVTDGNGCTNSQSISVIVNPLPVAAINGNTSICAGTTNLLTASGGTSYLWSNGAITPAISVGNAATYSVTVTSAAGCVSSASTTTVVNPLPSIAILGSTVICDGQFSTFTASGGSSYEWSSGENGASITKGTSGNYLVTVTNVYGCTATSGITLIVNANPVITISGIDTICYGNSTVLSANGAGTLSYHWNNSATTTSISISPTTTTTYSVTATNANNCSAAATRIVTVNPLPSVSISGNTTICPGESTILTASGNYSYSWSNGTTTAANVVSPLISGTSYSVTATNIYGCTATASNTVTVNPTPTLVVSGTPHFCAGSSTILTATGSSNVLWSTGATTQSISISTPGIYSVTITNGLNCSSSQNIDVVEFAVPTIIVDGNTSICNGESTTLSASGGVSYQWSTGATTSAIAVSPVNESDNSTQSSYSVTVTNGNNCSSSETAIVTIKPSPIISINGDPSYCQGSSTTLQATGGVTYLWNSGDTTATITVNTPNIFIVTVTNNFGCSNSQSIQIVTHPVPTPDITGSTTFCSGTNSTLTASGGLSYLWSTGETGVSINVYEENIYSVTATNSYGCTATATVTTHLLEAPNTTISGMDAICSGSAATLSVSDVFSSYLWNTGATTNSIDVSPTTTSTYSLTITNSTGCTSVLYKDVIVHPSPITNLSGSICEGATYNQNGFSIPIQETPGTFTFQRVLTTNFGCDSTVILSLEVKPKPTILGEIVGPEIIGIIGDYSYTISNVQNATGFQWSIDVPQWIINQNNSNAITMHVDSWGNGTLRVVAANSCGVSTAKTLVINSTADIEEVNNEKDVTIYPNPTHHYFSILLPNTAQEASLTISDVNGKTVMHRNFESDEQINIAHLKVGTYICKITTDKTSYIKKLIIAR